MPGPSASDPSSPIPAPAGADAAPPAVPPLPPDATPEQKDAHWFRHVYQGDKMLQLTLRAVLTGGVLGMLMAAANLYTTLAIGWAFGVAITASVMSYVVWTLLQAALPIRKMTILETNCMASTASAAGYSTGSTIATMFGALILMTDGDPASIKTYEVHPAWLIALFTLCTGLMGVFLAIPMKRQMINHEQLPFPSGIAAAETLKSLYSQSKEALHKAYCLIVGLGAGALVGILNTGQGTLNILDRFYKATRLELAPQYPAAGFFQAQGKPMIGFGFEPSMLLIAAGMIVGLRVSLSMLAGSILLYFVVAPQLIAMDVANAGKEGYIPSIELVAGGTIYHVFRWGLWGGTALMVCSSLTALALQWKTVGRAITSIFRKKEPSPDGLDARMKAIEVPFIWMIVGMTPITIAMVFVQHYAFEITWWAGIIAVAMSFILSLVACRATGETDTTPIGAMGKVMQLLYAVLAPGSVKANLASAGIAANSASSSADLLTDLKIGYLLGANPRRQFIAQFIGVFFGTIAIVPIWYLMVPTKAALEKFPAPATNQWARVAQVLVKGIDSLPDSAKIAIVIGALVGVALPIIEKLFVPAKHRKYFPSAMGIGLSWVLPFANALAFTIGALIAWGWSRLHKPSHEKFNIPLASGLVAGESLIKALIAMLATASGLAGWGL